MGLLRTTWWAAALALLPWSRPAAAWELVGTGPLAGATVQLTDDAELRYYFVDERLEGFEDRRIHDYVEQVNRLNAMLSQRWDNGDGLSLNLQLDEVALFSNRYRLDGVLYHSWQLYDPTVLSPWPDALVEFEKLGLQYRGRFGELALGDTYASFGRGIALNIKKNTDIDIDTSIRGARLVLGRRDTLLTLVSGLSNRQQISQDQPNLSISRDVSHMVSGLRVERHGLGPVDLGTHGVVYRFGRDEAADLDPFLRYAEPLDAAVVGASADAWGLGGVDVSVEGDLFAYLSPDMVGEVDDGSFQTRYGYAAYASASAYPGRAVVLVEAKSTRDTERINSFVAADNWEVAAVPTLEYERVITEDSTAAVNSNDIHGGRVRVDYSLDDGLFIPYLSVLGLRDLDTSGLHFNRSPESIGHLVAGMTVAGSGITSQLNLGARVDVRDDRAEGMDRLLHLDGDLSVPLGSRDHVELAVSIKQFSWGDNVQQQSDFMEMENGLVWGHGEHWLFAIYQDWSDNPLVTSQGNLGEDLYGAAEVTWKPGPNASLRAFLGAYKAGIRCSGGQCRSLPGFEGARLAWTSTF
ncbi:MAG: hypothetical protein D6798_16030 [Deltaproteobacteria bacterium]|nr:MAG: hypothetical protein D6798_16030 [Deltaproteobacteria bacterium]